MTTGIFFLLLGRNKTLNFILVFSFVVSNHCFPQNYLTNSLFSPKPETYPVMFMEKRDLLFILLRRLFQKDELLKIMNCSTVCTVVSYSKRIFPSCYSKVLGFYI